MHSRLVSGRFSWARTSAAAGSGRPEMSTVVNTSTVSHRPGCILTEAAWPLSGPRAQAAASAIAGASMISLFILVIARPLSSPKGHSVAIGCRVRVPSDCASPEEFLGRRRLRPYHLDRDFIGRAGSQWPRGLSRARALLACQKAIGTAGQAAAVAPPGPRGHIGAMAITIRTSLDEPETGQAFIPHRPARPEKAEGGRPFRLVSDYRPAGDQPAAIAELVDQFRQEEKTQVLLGVTGSGKTYTMAQVIETLQRPALVLAPNKILAAQLYGEFSSFFPDNAVEFFVSYYDYYQPEAYVPRSDTYIEKESSVNEAIDRMRHSATRSLLERDDVIIVASVSCIYGIGSVETYSAMTFALKKGQSVDQREIIRKLVALQYKRNDQAFARGNFRVRGDNLEIFPLALRGHGLADQLLRRRDRSDRRVRSAHRQEDRGTRLS